MTIPDRLLALSAREVYHVEDVRDLLGELSTLAHDVTEIAKQLPHQPACNTVTARDTFDQPCTCLRRRLLATRDINSRP